MESEAERRLEAQSRDLDKFLKRDFTKKILDLVSGTSFYGIFLVGVILQARYNLQISDWWLFVFLIPIVLVIISSYIKPHMGERKLISSLLYKIYVDLKNKKSPIKYILFLYSKSKLKQSEENLINKDLIFHEAFLAKIKFKEKLKELTYRLNSALKNNNIEAIKLEYIKSLAMAVYLKNDKSLLNLLDSVEKIYPEKISFPSWKYHGKKLASFKISQFLLCELSIILLLYLIYMFIIPDKAIIIVGFFTLTSAVWITFFSKNK